MHRLAVPVAVLAALVVTGCAAPAPPPAGPATVSVTKTATPDAGGQSDLEQLDLPVSAPDWRHVAEHWWLPEGQVTPGVAAEGTGSVHVRVPATYDVTAAAVAGRQDPSTFAGYGTVDVEQDGGTSSVLTGTADGIRYTVTVTPDETDPDAFTVVSVLWSPAA